MLDPETLPRAAAYLAQLPDGLDSYPACRVRTAVTRIIIERFPHALDHPGIEPAFADRLRSALDGGEWMSEVLGTATRILTRDVVFETDDEYDEWTFVIAGEIFSRPIYRMLMKVISPTIVMLGANRRWTAFREGTTLAAQPGKNGGEITLTFPPRLYTPLVLRGFGHAFRASLAAARAHGVRVELAEAADEHARWTAAWD